MLVFKPSKEEFIVLLSILKEFIKRPNKLNKNIKGNRLNFYLDISNLILVNISIICLIWYGLTIKSFLELVIFYGCL